MGDYHWTLRTKGGPGSGHWGHAGRPGQVGGSLPRDVAVSVATGRDWRERQERARRYGRFTSAASSGNVESTSHLGGGVADAKLVKYKDDGQGVWKAMSAADGDHDGNSEVAAYRIAAMLGIDMVPPTVFSKGGTSQLFVGDAEVGKDVNARLGDGRYIYSGKDLSRRLRIAYDGMGEQIAKMVILDFIIGNHDRHAGNVLVGNDGKLWAIDHGHAGWRAYRGLGTRTLNDWVGYGGYVKVPDDVMARLTDLTEEDFYAAMDGVSQGGNVNLAFAWGQISWLKKEGAIGARRR